MYNPQPFHTADGVELRVGMTVHALDSSTGTTTCKIIQEICEGGRKVIFEGGDGWRVDGVFSDLENAIDAHRGKFVNLQLDVDDAGLICYALAQRLKPILQEITTLYLAEDAELNQIQRMLPSNLQRLSREELVEQINPWISMQDTIEYVIEKITKEIDRANKFARGEQNNCQIHP